jgi:hypothetical protein
MCPSVLQHYYNYHNNNIIRTRAVAATSVSRTGKNGKPDSNNQTHVSTTFSGNSTLTLTNNDTEAIRTTSNGSTLFSFITQSAQGKETIRTQESETATATFYEIVQFNPVTRENKGIVIAVVHTNSTGILAPLNGMIVVGIDDIQPNGDILLTFWEWESGIGNSDMASIQEERR